MGLILCGDCCCDTSRKPAIIEYPESYDSTPEDEEVDYESEDWRNDFHVKEKRAKTLSTRTAEKTNIFVTKRERLRMVDKTSLNEKIKLRNNLVQFVKDERDAKLYASTVENDTLNHCRNTIRIAEMIVPKSENIEKELARQSEVIHQANNDIHCTEQEVNQTNYTLTGMRSVSGKVRNVVWRKKPNDQAYRGFKSDNSKCKGRPRSMSSPVPMKYGNVFGGTKQQQINGGLRHLNSVMDTIKNRQLVISDELQRQDKQVSEFSKNMGRTQDKINMQTNLMNSMRKE